MEAIESRQESPRADRSICALAMVLCALAISLANNVDLYDHISFAVCSLSLGIAACSAAIILPSVRKFGFKQRGLAVLIGLIIVIQAAIVEVEVSANLIFSFCVAAATFIAVVRARPPAQELWKVLLVMMAVSFFAISAITIHRPSNVWSDVLMSEQKGCQYLLHGVNPYAAKYPNIYGTNTPLYAPDLVDSGNQLKFGFGYPPLSLLMLMPSYVITGDVRYGLAAALGISAVLIGLAGQSRLGIMAAAALLTAPQWPRMLTIGWIEPMLILNFSLVMFCALRWRRGLPWALGLFLATKQYAVLALPLLPLLVESKDDADKWPRMLFKTAVVLAVINLPFFLWDPLAFMRSLVTAHFEQSFRPDALSYTAWIYRHSDGLVLPMWAALIATVAATGEALWRGVRSPAGFAGAIVLVLLFFFVFNKQAFCNYYYFMLAAAWWSVAAARLPRWEMAIGTAVGNPIGWLSETGLLAALRR
jgi:hypothetical protein